MTEYHAAVLFSVVSAFSLDRHVHPMSSVQSYRHTHQHFSHTFLNSVVGNVLIQYSNTKSAASKLKIISKMVFLVSKVKVLLHKNGACD